MAACGGSLSPTAEWNAYRNEELGFEIRYPQEAELVEGEPIRIYLPVTPGTTLSEKFVVLTVAEKAVADCPHPLSTSIGQTETVRLGEIEFRKEMGAEGAAGSTYETISYSTARGKLCYGLTFVLRSANPGLFDTPPPAFDRDKESEIFSQMLSTFRFI